MASSVKTIDEYISAYDGELKERMTTLRALIHSCHPDITEKIAWGIPTFVLKGIWSISLQKRSTWASTRGRQPSMLFRTVSAS